jgi:hypothetical protein
MWLSDSGLKGTDGLPMWIATLLALEAEGRQTRDAAVENCSVPMLNGNFRSLITAGKPFFPIHGFDGWCFINACFVVVRLHYLLDLAFSSQLFGGRVISYIRTGCWAGSSGWKEALGGTALLNCFDTPTDSKFPA